MSDKRAKRRRMDWRRKGRPARSRVPIGSELHRIRTKSKAVKFLEGSPNYPKLDPKWEPSIRKMNEILEKGRMSPKLRAAINSIITALRNNDIELAYELSAVKSYISGVIDPKDKEHHFQEDYEYNRKVFGEDIYVFLDGLHHDLAWEVDKLPSGTMIMTAERKIEKGRSKRKHPIVAMMEEEHRKIWKKAEGAS